MQTLFYSTYLNLASHTRTMSDYSVAVTSLLPTVTGDRVGMRMGINGNRNGNTLYTVQLQSCVRYIYSTVVNTLLSQIV